MKEIWKDIKNFEGLYQISNYGRVKSLPKKRNSKFNNKEIILKQFKNTNGYFQIDLWKNNKGKHILVHKLVAQTFLKNPNHYPFVNHKDENKLNNCVNNLEWCNAKYNCNYGTRNLRLSKPVFCIELNKKYKSIKKASEELSIQQAHISGCCKMKKHYKTAGGYHWQYVKEE